jgi:hypothetical protein
MRIDRGAKTMKIAKLLMVEVLVCLCALCAWASGPTISFGHQVKDFGKIPHGEKLTERFPFTNVGDDLLIVQNVEADCGCTEIRCESREVSPQAHSAIVAVLDTTTLRPGKNERHIHVRSNDLLRPIVTLTLGVEVLPEPR